MPNKKNKVKYGLKNVYYAKATFDDENNVTYGTPVRIPGAVSLSLDNNAEIEHFALLFEFDGDKHKTRHCLYNCVANRPSIESETKEDSAEPATDEFDLTASALANGYVKVKTTADVDSEVYNNWFTEVYTPAGFDPAPVEAQDVG